LLHIDIKKRSHRAYQPPRHRHPARLSAVRFIQSALREWAFGWTYQNYSSQRTAALRSWQNHYNWHRPHAGIGDAAPMSRLPASGNGVLTLHI
jgi:Integrase core domain